MKWNECWKDSDDEVIESDFVVVKVEGKSRKVRYIAQVDTIDGDEFKGDFLKKVPQTVGHVPVFISSKTDIAAFQRNDVIAKLPEPVKNTKSTRKCNQLVFPVDIAHWLNYFFAENWSLGKRGVVLVVRNVQLRVCTSDVVETT